RYRLAVTAATQQKEKGSPSIGRLLRMQSPELNQVVGVLGAGRMGLPIIGHLVRAGFSVVVYDVDPAKKEAVADKGADFATRLDEIAARCGTVMICVGYEEQLFDIMLGEENMLARLPHGA